MRFLLSRVCVIATAAVALSTGGVSGHKVCYPGCGVNDYTGYLSTLTPFSKTISLPKFYSAGDDRTLEKVTINTKVFFETEFFVKCTAGVTNCDTTFTGETAGGVQFGMYPSLTNSAALRTNLPQYWGRWGDYRLSDPNTQYDPAKRASKAANNIDPYFVEYSYPFFDIPGFVPETNDPGLPNKVWAHLTTIEEETIPNSKVTTLFYSASGDISYATDQTYGRIVIDSNTELEDPTYSDEPYTPGSTLKIIQYGAGEGRSPTPDGQLVSVGKFTFDGTTEPFTQTISLTDYDGANVGGGIDNNITPESMLALFTDTDSSASTIVWDTDAVGFVTAELSSGNYQAQQVTTGYSQMQIIYEYSGIAITQQDPQFSGFQGQSFQVHGYPGSYFHLISAPQFQMNGRFAYIANGHCNYNHTACWTHPGTYIDDVAIIVDELLVRITAGAVGQGYSVRINDEPFHAHAHGVNETSHTDVREFVPTKFYDAATRLTVHLRSPLEIYIRTELFALTIHNADHFFNIDSQILVRPILKMGRQVSTKYPHPQTGKPWFPQFPIHGFIGQTWAKATYAHNKQYQGDVDDYVETRPYATESIYSQYFKKFDDKNINWDN